ncbi:hypothetical protein ZWY2020_052167 [Hordeum vulgare]|nr:hypothetical protein ZWY2020_052167 [Hordeum vulgare]
MEGIIDNEIAHLVEVSEDWKVEQIVALEFMVEFPSTHMMRMANKSEKLSLLIHDIMTNIREAPRGKKACVTVHEVWMKLYGIPPKQRITNIPMVGTLMIGRPIAMDGASVSRSAHCV